MNNEIQKLIDETDYWDVEILDLKASYFGDEVELIIDNDEETCWKVSFLSCYKVLYETDAARRKIINVKDIYIWRSIPQIREVIISNLEYGNSETGLYNNIKIKEDIMSIADLYLTMFTILSDYYFEINKNDSLGSLLSDMDPNIFTDGKAADPATYNDWYNIINKYIVNDEIEKVDIVAALREFLMYYQQEFGYNLDEVISYTYGGIGQWKKK